jgi:hypothetical protein
MVFITLEKMQTALLFLKIGIASGSKATMRSEFAPSRVSHIT